MGTASSFICHNRNPSPSSALIDKVCAENKLNRGRVKCCVVCCMHRSTKFLLRKVNSDHLKNRRVDFRNHGYEAFYCILSAIQLRCMQLALITRKQQCKHTAPSSPTCFNLRLKQCYRLTHPRIFSRQSRRHSTRTLRTAC